MRFLAPLRRLAALVLVTLALAGGEAARAQVIIPGSQLPAAACPANGTVFVVGGQSGHSKKFGPTALPFCNANPAPIGDVTRDAIATSHIGAGKTVRTSGFHAAGDLGAGAVYSSAGATSGGWGATQDADGVWFNLVVPVSNPGYFGAPANDGGTLITSGDLAAHPEWRGTYAIGQSWDYVATQEAVYYAFAQGSTHGSIVWNYTAANYTLNRKLFIPSPNGAGGTAKYGINHQILTVAADVDIEFANSATCWDWQGAGSTAMWFTDSIAYGTIAKPCLESSVATAQPGAAAPLWQLDYDATYVGLRTHMLTITNAVFQIPPNMGGVAINLIAGGGGQGDDIVFINPEFVGNVIPDYCLWVNGANALAIQIFGGDMQGCTHDGIRNVNGSVFAHGTTMENQETSRAFTPLQSQFNTAGADFHSSQDFGGFSAQNVAHDIRSESYVGMQCDSGGGNCSADNFQIADGGLLNWFSAFQYQAGADAQVAANGVNHAVMVVDDGGPSGGSGAGWLTYDLTSTTGHIDDHTQAWTVNQWAGYTLNLRFSNGFTCQTGIASNTATSLILSPALACAPPASAALYHISGVSGGSAPSWNSLAAGHFIDNLNGSIGYGLSMTAGSAVVSSANLASTAAVNDYVVVPGADKISSAGNTFPMPLYAKVLSISGTNVTLSKAATLTVGAGGIGVMGYAGTPIADGTLKWIDIPFSAFFGVADLKDSFAAAGRATQVGTVTNSNGSWANWYQGPTAILQSPIAQNAQLGPNFRNVAPVASWATPYNLDQQGLAAGLADDITLTPTSAGTINFPAPMAGIARTLRLVLTGIAGNYAIAFGTNANAAGPITLVNGGKYVVVFESDGTIWNEVSRSGPNVGAGVTPHGDSAYAIAPTDRIVATSAALTAARTWTLPAASALAAGQQLRVVDQAGGVTASNTLAIARAGSDTINGAATSVTLSSAFSAVDLISDGVSKWSVIGGTRPFAATAHNFLTGASATTGQTQAQPACADLSGAAASCGTNASELASGTVPAAQLPNPSATTLGGIKSLAAVSHQWINAISTAGGPGAAQPASTDLSDAVARTTFTPTITFAAPGDLTVSYATQTGAYTKVGSLVCVWYNLVFTPTFTTASGNFQVSAPPVSPTDANSWVWPTRGFSPSTWPGSTDTEIFATWDSSSISIRGAKSGATNSVYQASNLTTATQYTLSFSGCYF